MKARRATVKSFASLKAWMLLCLVMMSVAGVKAQTPYAIWCEGNTTLYFINSNETYAVDGSYDGQTITNIWSGDEVTNYGDRPQWTAVVGMNCTKVVFDQSFREVKLTSLKRWFARLFNPALQFEGLENLNTSEVTDMSYMFETANRLKNIDLSSFNTCKVTTMKGMFKDCLALTTIDLSSFNTENVTDMSQMFYYCKALTSLDLSHFNTQKVTDMTEMFYKCQALTVLDLRSFNTENVTSMYYMFFDCEVLSNLNVSSFNTKNVTDMTYMFAICKKLTSLDLSHFDTGKVTSMNGMFGDCKTLSYLDLSNFKTDKVENMNSMFSGCNNLKTIFCNNDWNTENVTDANSMFNGCTSLVGGNGTAYDAEHIDNEYARIDRAETPGYFTKNMTPYAIWCEGNSTLYFTNSNETYAVDGIYDGQTITGVWSGEAVTNSGDQPEWSYTVDKNDARCTSVVFDRSFKTVKPNSLSKWFFDYEKLASITGLENLNTSEVTSMVSMFIGCESLTSLDLRKFDVSKVESTYGMFSGCRNLKTIYCNKAWDKVKDSENMFSACDALVGGNNTAYNGSHVDANYARPDAAGTPGYFTEKEEAYAIWCEGNSTLYFTNSTETYAASGTYDEQAITGVWSGDEVTNTGDHPQWNTVVGMSCTKVVFDESFQSVKPKSLAKWFFGFSNMTSIEELQNLNTSEATSMASMFQGCTSLTSLDLSGFNTENVTNMASMFAACNALESLDLSSFNTENVTSMYGLFQDCFVLTNLDLSNFKTDMVQNMKNMFIHCKNLRTIYCDNDWNKEQVTGEDMFTGCTSLVGGTGTAYDESHTDIEYARPDGVPDIKGYFSEKPYVIWVEDDKTLYFTCAPSNEELLADKLRWIKSGELNGKIWRGDDVTNTGDKSPQWAEVADRCTNVVFDRSFYNAKPTSMNHWFCNFKSLTSIEGLWLLNTSEITDMAYAFTNCENLESLDMSYFHTSKATTMSNMFAGCSKVETLDLRNFDVNQVTTMMMMFENCSSLTTIYCNDDWSKLSPAPSDDRMFDGCSNLKGGKETMYDHSYIRIGRALPDGGTDAPGYFTEKHDIYVLWSEDAKTLYFTSGAPVLPGNTFAGNTISAVWDQETMYIHPDFGQPTEWPAWSNPEVTLYQISNQCTTVVFDESFSSARPENISFWFYGFKELTSVQGMENLNTSEVTDMHKLFSGCSKLASIDLSHFNTVKVTNMSALFEGCSALESLDLSKFITTSADDMSIMFSGCSALTSLDLGSFNTENVIYMKSMFEGCSALTSLDLSNFSTEKVRETMNMFDGCSALTSLDLGSFIIENVKDFGAMFRNCSSLTELDLRGFNPNYLSSTWNMFNGCTNLTTIRCGNDWSAKHDGNADDMFSGCPKLVGCNNTSTESAKVYDASYARPDLEGAPGYFTVERRAYAIWCADNKTLYFTNSFKTYTEGDTYNDQTITNIWSGNDVANTGAEPQWISSKAAETCTKVVFEENFQTLKPTSLASWFYNMQDLTSIEGLKHLNTSEATTMSRMFYASGVQTLDLRKFDVSKVTSMMMMFDGCSNLRTIYCNDDWSKLSPEPINDRMFSGCISLEGGMKTKYDSGHNLIGYARPDEGTDAPGYFTMDKEMYVIWCEDNATLYFAYGDERCILDGVHDGHAVTKYWTEDYGGSMYVAVEKNDNFLPKWSSKNMGTNIITDNPDYIADKCQSVVIEPSFSGARPTSLRLWFGGFEQISSIEGLENLNTSEVTDMSGLFIRDSKLASLDLSTFDTSKVTDMSFMFDGCSSLTSLDLSNFNTEKVENMYGMFRDCSSLTSLDLSSFNTAKVENMTRMFQGCSSLTSLDLNNFDTGKVQNMSSMFQDCSALTSLDLNNFNTENVGPYNEKTFSGCYNLKTIYCANDWKTDNVLSSDNMFYNCLNLIGGNNTKFSSDHVDVDYAHPDGDSPGYFTVAGEKFEYTISDAMVGTLYLDFAVTLPANQDYFHAYTVKSISETGTIHLKEVSDVIPANTAVIIFGNEGTYKMMQISREMPAINDNLLCGVTEATSVSSLKAQHGADIYVLSLGKDSYINFRKAGGSVKTIPANRAYLPYSTASGAKELSIVFDEEGGEATGIDNVATEKAERTGVYNLAGQRVAKPQHGIYIVNGKKVFIP